MEGRREFFSTIDWASKSTFSRAPVFSFYRSFSFFLLLTRGARDRAEREHEEGGDGAHRELLVQSRFLFELRCAPFFFFEKSEQQAKVRNETISVSQFLSHFCFFSPLSFSRKDRRDARMRHRRFLLMLLARSPVPSHSRRCSVTTATASSSSFSSSSASAATTATAAATTPIPATTLASRFAALRVSSGSSLLRGGPRASPGRCANLSRNEKITRARARDGKETRLADG